MGRTDEDAADFSPDIVLFFAAKRSLEMILDRALLPRGLSRAHYRVLSLLRSEPDIAVGRVSDLLDQTPQALWNTVRALQSRGLVRARTSPEDGRVRLLSLTAAGRREQERAVRVMRDYLAAASDAVGEEEWAAWRAAMEILGRPCRHTFG